MDEMVKYLKALLLLGIAKAQRDGERGDGNAKLEVLLADSGFAHAEIATILGKTQAAVAKAVSRARQSRKVPTADASLDGGNENV
jgi:hypothetical protein